MIPPTFPFRATVPAAVGQRIYEFRVGAGPTEHLCDGRRLWLLAIELNRKLDYLPVRLDPAAESPTQDDLAHLLDKSLVAACQADADPVTLAGLMGTSTDEALVRFARAHRAAAVFDFLGVSPSQAYHVAGAISPLNVSPAFAEVL